MSWLDRGTNTRNPRNLNPARGPQPGDPVPNYTRAYPPGALLSGFKVILGERCDVCQGQRPPYDYHRGLAFCGRPEHWPLTPRATTARLDRTERSYP
jgi:hypothetical protein